MHEQEVLYFTDALKLVREKFYIDAIQKFKQLIDEFPDSDLADDAMYNIALCYYEMNQFEKAISNSKLLIERYPDATITALENSNEYGRTAAKAYYLMVNSFLALGRIENANNLIPEIKKYSDSYVSKEGRKQTFAQIAEKAIELYDSIKQKRIS